MSTSRDIFVAVCRLQLSNILNEKANIKQCQSPSELSYYDVPKPYLRLESIYHSLISYIVFWYGDGLTLKQNYSPVRQEGISQGWQKPK